MFNLTDHVCVVSGASSGLGVQMAKGYAKQGAHVVVMARRKEKLEKVAEEIKKLGVDCLAVPCDVTDTESISSACKAIISKFGKVDVLVNCAGASRIAGITDMTDEDWNFTIDTDLTSVFKVTREFSKHMIDKNYGRIINIASMYGLVGNQSLNLVAYHASKGGVINLTRAVAVELSKYNITCNALCPGYFETELTREEMNTEAFQNHMKATVPMKRNGKEGELNAAAIFLASKESSYVTGTVIPVDGGYTAV